MEIKIDRNGKYKPIDFFNITTTTLRKRLPKNSAEAFYNLLIKNILSNKYGFNLTKNWLGTKKRKGWDRRPFIAEGYYIRAIQIFQHEGHLTIGFRKTEKHPRTGIPIGEISKILEYGLAEKGIAARPLWRRTIEEFFRRYPEFITKEIEKLLS